MYFETRDSTRARLLCKQPKWFLNSFENYPDSNQHSRGDISMTQDALEIIHLRNHFYYDNYRRLMLALVFGCITLALLVGTLLYLVIYPPAPRYFAVSEEGRLIPIVSMKEPNLSDAALLQWTTQAVVRAFSYNYVNYREALQSLRDDFTELGWKHFTTELNDSNNLSSVIHKKLIVSAVPTGVPVIVEQGVRKGVYVWKVQFPLLVTYESPSERIPQSFQVEALIVRLSTLQSARGIGIQQLVMTGSGSIRH
jgi:intracellular multiplication protein IcmL